MLRFLTSAERAPAVFALAVAIAYGALPFGLVLAGLIQDEHFAQLAAISTVATLSIYLGARLPLLDGLTFPSRWRMGLGLGVFNGATWGLFAGFVAVAMVTAERIPLVAAFQGADPETVAVLRERFLKAREGWQSILVYVNGVLSGGLIPYSLALMLFHRTARRWWFFAAFLAYCLSFGEKFYFTKALIPLLYLSAQRKGGAHGRPGLWLGVAAALLVGMAVLSGAGTGDADEQGAFFSNSFAPQGAIAHLIWRGVAVPVVGAADALRVFDEQYGGRPLLGATSAFMASLLGVERIQFEREVFFAQWGQNETETGSSNAVFVTEGFVNFGYAGVVAYSLVVGLILRLFVRSRDEALRSLWPLFCFGVFVAPLTGTLLSNGIALVMVLSATIRLHPSSTGSGDRRRLGAPSAGSVGSASTREGSRVGAGMA